MDSNRLREILNNFKDGSVGVIGDYCIDAYWKLDPGEREISVETLKPTYAVIEQRYSLGGAANVVANLAAIGIGDIKAFAIIGPDIFGGEMLRQLQNLNVDCSGVVAQEKHWDTSVYAKPFLYEKEDERIDFGRYNSMSPETENTIIQHLEKAVKEIDVLIINQQLPKGIITEKIIETLNRLAVENPQCNFIVDSRDKSRQFKNMILKMNAVEAAYFCGERQAINYTVPLKDLERYAHTIHQHTIKPFYITRGEQGMVLCGGEKTYHVAGISITGKVDTVGAGDTVMSALGAALSADATLEEAAEIANLAAAVTVKKLQQTGTASQEEILELAGKGR